MHKRSAKDVLLMGVEQYTDNLDASMILATLLDEFSAVMDYRSLRDTLPRRLTSLLKCRCVLMYQRMGETLQFASGSFADQPGWSTTLLAVAHINPIELQGEMPEAECWRTRKAVLANLGSVEGASICTPLFYRQRAIGVLVAVRGVPDLPQPLPGELPRWSPADLPLVAVVANVVAMLLENARLSERDRERIHELSLLNGIASQMNTSLRERERVERIVVQRTREISAADVCALLLPEGSGPELSWLPRELHTRLFQHWQRSQPPAPLVLERVNEVQQDSAYFRWLSPRVKTFFALPLIGNRDGRRVRGALAPHLSQSGDEGGREMLGIIVGAYYNPCKLRREALVLLQVLANQAATTLENIALMADLVEARDESRRLLHQVLDDQRLKALILENIPSGLLTLDIQGRITSFNRAAETVLDYRMLEIQGQAVLNILPLRTLAEVWKNGQVSRENLRMRGRQGREIVLDVTLVPLRDDQGQQIGTLVTFADVTEMHRLEEEKRRLDRLASLGEMSANVAHEVRNPLASIKTSMQILLDDLELHTQARAGTEMYDSAQIVLQEVERMDGIVRDLLLFARPRQLHLVEFDLAALCDRLLRFLQPQCEERGVEVHQLYHDLPLVRIDVSQLEQVLMNLFLNALHAMSEGGVLSVIGQVMHHLPLSSPGGSQESQTWLELAITDTGEGIAQENLERIFQPFHTTKAHGIGLGLPISRRLIEDHHGQLLVESQLGYGTTMLIRLPVSGSEPRPGEIEESHEVNDLDEGAESMPVLIERKGYHEFNNPDY